ncbi:UNVERIFIED_CONTAM: ecdysteroid kinase [Williamsia faeni]
MSTSVAVPVPETLDTAQSPEWLTAALQRRFPGIKILGVTPGPVVSRVSTNARFTIEYSGTTSPGPSRSLCVKGYFNEIGQAARYIGESETYFYRDLADAVGVRTLTCLYAEVDPVTRHGVVITEDLVAEGGEFLDASSAYTPEQTASTLGDMARLHAATWNNPDWADQPWLASRIGKTLTLWGDDGVMSRIGANMFGANASGVSQEIRDPKRIVDAYRNVVTHSKAAVADRTLPWCVIHGDSHPGNLFLDPAGRPSLFDWQLVQRGMWYLDVGYHIAATLSVEDRRRSEDELLRHYLQSLADLGVEPPPFETARRALGLGIVHGLYLWSITAEVEPRLIEILLHRLGTAAADHEALTQALALH